MTYDEATAALVTRDEARDEIEKHDCNFNEFIEDCGAHETYCGGAVLDWLGY